MMNGIDFMNLELARQINDERVRDAEEYHRGALARRHGASSPLHRWWNRRTTPPTIRPRAA